MKPFLDLMSDIYTRGKHVIDRTGVGRHRIFGTQTRFDMSKGELPVVTTRKIYTGAIPKELLFFIGGHTDNKVLTDQGVNIWNNWAVTDADIEAFADKYSEGNEDNKKVLLQYGKETFLNSIGEMYGYMWRNAPREDVHRLWPLVPMEDLPSDKVAIWTKAYEEYKDTSISEICTFEQFCTTSYYTSVDQLNELVVNLKKRPFSSRLIVSAWIPSAVPFEHLKPQENVLLGRGCLAPCHAMFQCFVTPSDVEGGKHKLSLLMYQRSVDTPVGAAYNIAQYSMLLAMLAHVSDMDADEFIWTTGDTHIYADQMPLVQEQLSREPLPLPKLWLNPEVKDLFKFTLDDIRIEGYQHHPHIPYPVAT